METSPEEKSDLEILVKELLAVRISRDAVIRQMQRLTLDYPAEDVVALITGHTVDAYDAYEKRFTVPESIRGN